MNRHKKNRDLSCRFFWMAVLGVIGFLLLPFPAANCQNHGDVVRAEGDPNIYLIQNGQKRAFASQDIFRQMGFRPSDMKDVDPQLLAGFPEGPPIWTREVISSFPEGSVIRLKGDPSAYVIRNGKKCFIPDPETFQSLGFKWSQVMEVDRETLNKIATGIPVASVKPPFQYVPPGKGPAPAPPPGTVPVAPPGFAPPPPYPQSPPPVSTTPGYQSPPNPPPPSSGYPLPPPPGPPAPVYPPPPGPEGYPPPSPPQAYPPPP